MPLGDGTGPAGYGPMTGRGAGYCAGYGMPGYMNPVPGGGWGIGLGWGMGFGWGRGRGRGWGRLWQRLGQRLWPRLGQRLRLGLWRRPGSGWLLRRMGIEVPVCMVNRIGRCYRRV